MIGYLSGLVIDKNEKTVLILAQSVGYKVSVTTELLSRVKIDQKIQAYIHTAVREDDIALYGFLKKEEVAFFEQIIGVSGIGPKIAMEILSSPLRITQSAILNGDVELLTKIKGLGKKTAERMILELKNKISILGGESGEGIATGAREEAVMALMSLGYEKYHVVRALTSIPKEISETEDIIRHFLKQS